MNIISPYKQFAGKQFNSALGLDGNGDTLGTGTGIFNSNTLAIVARVKPDFVDDEGAWRVIIDTTIGATRFFLTKSVVPDLRFYAGNTVILLTVGMPAAWKEKDWNVIEVTADTDNDVNEMLVNGVSVVTSVTDWTTADPAEIDIGSQVSGANTWIGLIDYIYIYSDITKTTLTAKYEFNGNYRSDIDSANDLLPQGSGNKFVDVKDFEIMGATV